MPNNDKLARNIVDGAEAYEAGEKIRAVLERAIQSISKYSDHARERGRLSPDEQHAVRVLRSRQRLIDRQWLAVYGKDPARTIASLELSFLKPDDGTIFKFGEKMHAQGRLSCKACATWSDGVSPIPVPACKVCQYCKRGVEHAINIQEITASDDQGIHLAGDTTTTMPEAGQPGVKVRFIRHFFCDNCAHKDVMVL